jgi:hypothetical protein
MRGVVGGGRQQRTLRSKQLLQEGPHVLARGAVEAERLEEWQRLSGWAVIHDLSARHNTRRVRGEERIR